MDANCKSSQKTLSQGDENKDENKENKNVQKRTAATDSLKQ